MTVSHWESGASEPGTATLAALAALAGVDPGWLAFGSASSAPDPFEEMDSATRRLVEAEMEADQQGGTSLFRSTEAEAEEAEERALNRSRRRLTASLRRAEEIAAMPEGRTKMRALERHLRNSRVVE
jgi:transcriptional regulator with XRE-family HTH domain